MQCSTLTSGDVCQYCLDSLMVARTTINARPWPCRNTPARPAVCISRSRSLCPLPQSTHQHSTAAQPLTLLLAHTDSPAPPARGLAVLSAHPQTPVVPQTSVRADLLQALQVLTQLRVDGVGEDVLVLAVDDVALTVEEPGRDLVLGGVLDDGDDALEFFGGEFAGAVGSMFC